ncbi:MULTISPECIES: EamA family transporter [Acinetobacter]|jgi:transporter family protein|uniref:EamA family transporter n=3 Tax=Acinetobacter TaxID=469 RepID=A0A4Q7AXB5_9GAMM|nr:MULTISPECIES: EamA family transporter [Acinetobacter]MCW8040541.1 EamA family transporter [Acinetobacter entericus]RZG65198.1 EamA family transporter [Acinetobacter bouvetii]
MNMNHWLVWATLSACFAALTAIFAKVGLRQIDSDLATLIRTVIIAFVLSLLVWGLGKWQNPLLLSGKTWLFLTLSAFATGASWLCYFRALQLGQVSQVAPIDKLSVVLATLFAVLFLGERPSVQEYLGIILIALGVLTIALK